MADPFVDQELVAIEKQAGRSLRTLQKRLSERDALRKVAARCMSIAGVIFARMGMTDEEALALVAEKLPSVMEAFRRASVEG